MSIHDKDYYGGHASDYKKFRPTYPEQLFTSLLSHCPNKQLAWDCGTGNGQVAIRLSQDFDKVVATDLSPGQIGMAEASPKVEYRVAAAEQSGLADDSVSLLTVGSAVHWFDLDSFYQEAQRVLAPGGILAVWTYAPEVLSPIELSLMVRGLAQQTLKDDWPEGMHWVTGKYQDLPFPFEEVPVASPDFVLRWTPQQLTGWITTWAAVKRNQLRTGVDPTRGLMKRLNPYWPDEDGGPCDIKLPLYLKVGRKA